MPHDERQLSQTYEYRRYELPPEFPVLLAADACRCAAPHGGLQPRGGRAAGSPGGGAQALGV
ncbi:MAG: hypothetical protein LBL83_03325, partial [Clostridiales bacterium]|nr:hypothetical protein [Clostridiales bacterium]